jgi:hypothetical protein
MIKKIYLLVFITFLSTTVSIAQNSVDINFDGLSFLDNREYKDFVARSRTYSAARTALDFGLNLDSLNHFVVGANGIHEFGAIPFFLKVDPVAYYKFESKSWLFDAGAFPRKGLIDNYPRALLNDTLQYYRPNMEGLLARYQNPHFMETGWIDWVSRQTDTEREQFLFGAEGKYLPSLTGPFYVTHFFFLEHNAGAAILQPDDHIQDNGAAQIRLGLDFSKRQHLLDSLSVEAGVMTSLERTRGVDGLQTPTGFVSSLYASYGRFAAFDEFYIGAGSHINYGDSFYEKHFYDRLDLMFTPFLGHHLKGQFVLSIHRTPGFTSNQEVFRVTYDLGRKIIARFKDDKSWM